MKKRITAKCSPSHEPDLMRGRMLLDKMSMDTDGNVV